MTITPSDALPPRRASDRIRAAARELFYRCGIRAVGVEEIVARAGVTKPSLYRSFASKDELAVAYLTDYDAEFWRRFDLAAEKHRGDPRAQIAAFLAPLARRAANSGFRGCGLANAAVEFPDAHPARTIALRNKTELRRRLRELARDTGAAEADTLGDGLLLLIEGAYVSGQMFAAAGPAASVAENARLLIEAHLAR